MAAGGAGERGALRLSRAMKRILRHASRALPALLAVALAVFVLRSADLGRVASLVRSLGWRLPLLLLPNLAVTLTEAVAW